MCGGGGGGVNEGEKGCVWGGGKGVDEGGKGRVCMLEG